MHTREGILLMRLKSMGDVLFTLPAVHCVRANNPETRITFLVSKEYASLVQGFAEVNSVLPLDRSCFRGLHPVKIVREVLGLLRQMGRERLRLAIDLQGYGETAFLTRASGAPERWGIVSGPGRKWAYTHSSPRNLAIHPAEEHLALLGSKGFADVPIKNHFVLPQHALSEATEFFSTHGLLRDRPTLFIQPFTSAKQKNWPLQRYFEVARHWRSQGWQILFGGGPGDRAALGAVLNEGWPLAAGSSLLVSAGLTNLSTLVLGGDTGLLHLAVAMGKRVVMLMRSMLPGSTHPFQHKDWAIGPKAEGLIDSISAEAVNQHCDRAAAELGLPAKG
jgi:ADP-heptose:LPS heptosyltransferase